MADTPAPDFRQGGSPDGPLLVLLHGLGATGAVWDGLIDLLPEHWPGGWVAPDLRGHGAASPLPRYSFGGLTARVAAHLPEDRPIVALGHSMGGVLALTLASGWFNLPVVSVAGVGIKVRWTEEELAGVAALAKKPSREFATRDEAAQRHLKVSGLLGLVPEDHPAVETGLAHNGYTWRLAVDPKAFAVGVPDLPGLLRTAKCPVLLAAGEQDPMCPPDHLRDLVDDPVTLPGLGHNAHVQDPKAFLPLLSRLLP